MKKLLQNYLQKKSVFIPKREREKREESEKKVQKNKLIKKY